MDGTVQSLQEEGATVVAVEHDGRLLGVIAVRDELRPEVSRVIERLRAGNWPHRHAYRRQPANRVGACIRDRP